MDRQITVGNNGYEVTYIYNDKQQAITGEVLPSGNIVPINLNLWSSPDGKINRYYVSRGGKKIGWIAQELDKCNGNSSTEQHWVNNIMAAMQQTNTTIQEDNTVINNTTTTTKESAAMTNNSLTTLLDNYSLADIAYGVEQKYNCTCTADDVTSKGISVAHEDGNTGWLTDGMADDLLAAMPNLRSADDNY